MYTNVKSMSMICGTISSTRVFLQSMCVSDSFIHMDAYKCLVHVNDDSSTFSSNAIFLHPCPFVSLSSTWMHKNVTHVDDSSNYFVHNAVSSSIWICDSLIHMDAYKCKVYADDRRTISSTTIFRHPCAFVIHLDVYKC
jgi:hypothetical protein